MIRLGGVCSFQTVLDGLHNVSYGVRSRGCWDDSTFDSTFERRQEFSKRRYFEDVTLVGSCEGPRVYTMGWKKRCVRSDYGSPFGLTQQCRLRSPLFRI